MVGVLADGWGSSFGKVASALPSLKSLVYPEVQAIFPPNI